MRLRGGLVLVWTLAALSTPARAQERADAKGYYERATALFALEKYGEAAANYEKSFELRPDAAILYNAAQAHRLAGNKVRALALYRNLLRIYASQIHNKAEIQRRIEELQRAVANDETVTKAPPLTTLPAEVSPTSSSSAAPSRATESPPSVAPKFTEPPAPKLTEPAASSPPASSAQQPQPVPSAAMAPAPKPLVKRPWFWAVVGGGVAVVATAVAVGVVFGGTSHVGPPVTFGAVRGN
jgi:hypothetical protein